MLAGVERHRGLVRLVVQVGKELDFDDGTRCMLIPPSPDPLNVGNEPAGTKGLFQPLCFGGGLGELQVHLNVYVCRPDMWVLRLSAEQVWYEAAQKHELRGFRRIPGPSARELVRRGHGRCDCAGAPARMTSFRC